MEIYLGVDPQMAGKVDGGKDEISEFLGDFVAALTGHRLFQLRQLLLHLRDHGRDVALGPVETGLRGALLYPVGAQQRWHAARDSRHVRGIFLFAPALGRLYLFPVAKHVVRILDADVPEDVGMTPDELVGQPVHHVRDREVAALLRHAGDEHHLQHEVAALLAHIRDVFGLYRLDEFVGLFYYVAAQRHVVLLTVPGAAVRRTQTLHHLCEPDKFFRHCFFFLHGESLLPALFYQIGAGFCS
ncbi:hypothetical protein SDC9_155730 [bioreactor metagenome]|uniref:Uncharacterized protein n=1 Tax=bioreactor metagenome TaxID=1076179 RepID=A0A645F2B7_9ZZZZ